MTTRAQTAGIITFVSLIVPWGVGGGSSLSFLWIRWTIVSYSYLNGYGSYFSNVLQFPIFDILFSIVIFIALLLGAILLLARSNFPKLGASIVLSGVAFSILYLAYLYLAPGGINLISNGEVLVPVGLFLSITGAIVGLRAKSLVAPPNKANQSERSLDRLVKLKELLDSGALTREEFEKQKQIVLQKDTY
jgi:ABC-type multidrug transport system fused ATPase/permease subunit